MKKKLMFISLTAVLIVVIGTGFVKLYNTRKVKANLSSAIKSYISDDYENAILSYENVLKTDKKNTDAYKGLIKVYLSKGDKKKARETIGNALKVVPEEPKILVDSAFLYSQNNKLDEAIEIYKKALAINPNESAALSGLYSCYIEKGDKEAADKLINDTAKNSSIINDFVLNSLIETKNYDKFFSLISEDYKKDKDNIIIYDSISHFNQRDGNFVVKLKEFMKNNPNDTMYKMFYIICCDNEKLVDEGLNIAKNIENDFKDNKIYKIQLANFYQTKGDKDLAKKLFAELEKDYPDDFDVFHSLGWYYYGNEDYNKAVEYAKKSIILNPDYLDNYCYLMPASLYKLEKYNEALKYYMGVLNYYSMNANIYCKIGSCYDEMEEYKKAINYYNKSLILDSELDYSKLRLSVCYDKVGNREKAMELVNELISKYPEDSIYCFLKATLYVFGDNYSEALSLYQSTEKDYKDTYVYLNNIACVKYELSNKGENDKNEAIKTLNRAKQIAIEKKYESQLLKTQKNIDAINSNNEGYTLWYWYY